ncbi:dipeptide/oligopeptide/nickel ABC transporter permease/ATP-binding protein [Microbacterium sp. A196]|uniref:dipeptide/oligopeptide/nickel ABC transporter permease/ATP-binding protein n=1 Tax=Microbacterium sp. A196 TaxID=3457320 RepID=UPI003FD21C08
MKTTLITNVPARRTTWGRFIRRPAGVAGAIWLVFLVLASITAPLWVPYPPDAQDFTAILAGPSTAHWLGTDELGRDLLSRIFTAAAGTLLGSSIAVLMALLVGTGLALWAASNPRVAPVIDRCVDVIMSTPTMIVILTVIGVIGTNIPLVMAIFGSLISAGVFRIMQGQAKSLQSQLYVDAARVDGLSKLRISMRHILPGLSTTIAVQVALLFAIALLFQAGLAFIGFGPALPAPSWGGMIQSASGHVYDHPWMMVPTGVVLAATVLAANAVGVAMARPTYDPVPLISLGARRHRQSHSVNRAPVASSESAPRLEVRKLSVSVDDGPDLVTDVSFAVDPGRVLGLVGESGSGKTMTALSLLGLLPGSVSVSSGSIEWNGRDLAAAPEAELEKVRGHEISLISQEPMRALDPMFTVGSQLVGAVHRLRGGSRNEARETARTLLQNVGIVDTDAVLKSFPHHISGGMAQRVAIALALAGRPKLLIADEPTTALDVTVQAETLSLLRALIEDTNMAMVIVTHDLGVVADICDDVAVMYAGQVVESGSVVQVLDTPSHPYTKALLAADPHADTDVASRTRLATIPGQVPQPRDWPTGCRFASRCQFAVDACGEPVTLTVPFDGSASVRCIRAEEIAATGLEWEVASPGDAPSADRTRA